jgi:FecR protein
MTLAMKILRGLLIVVGLLSWQVAGAAQLVKLQGVVQVARAGQVLSAFEGQRLQEGDVIETSVDSETLIRFDDGARLVVRSQSHVVLNQLKLKGPVSARQKTVKIVKGALRYVSAKTTVRRKVAFLTPTSTIGIRGTDIEILVAQEVVQDNNPGTYLKVNTGTAHITAPDGAAEVVNPGEVAYGGEPELQARGGGPKRPSARKVAVQPDGLGRAFRSSALDALLR